MPDLSPRPAKPAPKVETFEQRPLASLATALPKEPPKSKPSKPISQFVAPEELHNTIRFARPLAVLAGLALAGVIAVAVSNRGRPKTPEPSLADKPAESTTSAIPGGSPTAITQIPEVSFAQAEPKTEPNTEQSWPIQRLPAIDSSTPPQFPTTAVAQATDGNSAPQAAAQPGVAWLPRQIEQPQPQSSYDSTRSSLR
jgi:hypothetical protein